MPRSTHARIDELKSNGLKATVPRLKVMQIFRDSRQRDLSAEDVCRELLGEHSEVALATVYRVLMRSSRPASSSAAPSGAAAPCSAEPSPGAKPACATQQGMTPRSLPPEDRPASLRAPAAPSQQGRR